MKPKPPYVSYYLDRHKKLRWRFRRTGLPESQTREPFGSEAWWSWYNAALNGTPAPVGAARTVPGSMTALIVAYYASADFKGLRPATQRTYRGILERYRDQHGSKPVDRLEAKHIRRQMDQMSATPAAANNMLKVLRAVTRFAVDRGLVDRDPTIGVRMLRYRSEGYHTWTEAEVAAFESRWPVGTKQRLAFDLLLYTAQRPGDVRKMTFQQVRAGRVQVRQDKTGQLVDIPMHPRLRLSLDSSGRSEGDIITGMHGRAYADGSFGNWFKKALRAADLGHCCPHGLRKSASRRLAEAGCSTHQIAAVTGHQTLKEIERYTQAAGRRGLADAALSRIA